MLLGNATKYTRPLSRFSIVLHFILILHYNTEIYLTSCLHA